MTPSQPIVSYPPDPKTTWMAFYEVNDKLLDCKSTVLQGHDAMRFLQLQLYGCTHSFYTMYTSRKANPIKFKMHHDPEWRQRTAHQPTQDQFIAARFICDVSPEPTKRGPPTDVLSLKAKDHEYIVFVAWDGDLFRHMSTKHFPDIFHHLGVVVGTRHTICF